MEKALVIVMNKSSLEIKFRIFSKYYLDNLNIKVVNFKNQFFI